MFWRIVAAYFNPLGHAMHKYFIIFIVTILGFSAQVNAETPLYSISSNSQGAPFDLVVTETKRESNKSYLSVPGFDDRTARGSRWLMCAYTDLVVKRGFSYWTVAYPPANSDVLVVGLTNSPIVTVQGLLGKDFDSEMTLGDELMPVEHFFPMCGMQSNKP